MPSTGDTQYSPVSKRTMNSFTVDDWKLLRYAGEVSRDYNMLFEERTGYCFGERANFTTVCYVHNTLISMLVFCKKILICENIQTRHV